MIYVIYFSDNGSPRSGLTPTVITYKKVADGVSVAPVPTISAIGGGGYKFTATPTEAIYVEIDGGGALAAFDRYKVLQVTPNDNDLALIAASSHGVGAITWVYNLVDTGGDPIPDADVWVTSDIAGTDVLASGRTDQYGNVTFYLDAGTVYVWSQKTGFTFPNPDTEVVT